MDRSGDELGRPAGASKLRLRAGAFELVGAAAAAIALLFLMLPLVAIFVHGDLMAGIRSEEARQSLWLSLQTSLASLAIMVVFGTPIAHLLATRRFRGRTLVLTAFELPLVLPPAVDRTLLDASRTLGAGSGRTFWRVAVPLARTGLGAGAALGWARAIGEFGATIIFAGSLAGITRTAPIEIYVGLADNLDAGLATAAVLVAASAGVLLSVKLLSRGRPQRFTPI